MKKPKRTEIEKAYKAYSLYKNGRWALIALAITMFSVIGAFVAAFINKGYIPNVNKLELVGVISICFMSTAAMFGVIALIAKTYYQSLKIKELTQSDKTTDQLGD